MRHRNGKLVASKRINWVDPVGPLFGATGNIPFAVSQSYRYEGRDGRISARQTRASFNLAHYAFLTEFEWDRQGNLDLLSYPRCLHAPCAGNDVARDVDFTYDLGFLKTVEGFATSLTYQLGGMLHQVVHANGVTETIATKPTFPSHGFGRAEKRGQMAMRQLKLEAQLFALMVGLSSLLLFNCGSSSGLQSAELVTSADLGSREYSIVGKVEASCTKMRCPDTSSESCAKRLADKAGQLGGDAVIVDEEGFKSKGHAGAEPVEHWCKGRALSWKRE